MAKYAKVELKTATLLIRKYFALFQKKTPPAGALTGAQIESLTSQEYLKNNATSSLDKRVRNFRKVHP